ERPAESAALLGGIDAHHVDLPDGWRCRALLAGRMHLSPVETRHVSVPFRDEEARRVEPRLLLTQFQVVSGPAALFGMLGERPAVQAQPLILILAGDEGAQRAAGHQDRRR